MNSFLFHPSASVRQSSLSSASFMSSKILIGTHVTRISSAIGKRSPGIVIRASSQKNAVCPVLNSSRTKASANPIVVIDNYDSFTYNLCQYLGELACDFEVYRNDDITVDELKKKNPRGLLISSGPGTPQDSGISLQSVSEFGPSIPLLGVSMGLQCIGVAFGGKIVCSPFGVVHGKRSLVYYNEGGEDGLLAGLSNFCSFCLRQKSKSQTSSTFPGETYELARCCLYVFSPFTAGRYHSLVIERESFPSDKLEITAWTEDGLIMAARHKVYKHLQGVQFHPESILTDEGRTIVRNFIKLIERKEAESQN